MGWDGCREPASRNQDDLSSFGLGRYWMLVEIKHQPTARWHQATDELFNRVNRASEHQQNLPPSEGKCNASGNAGVGESL